MLSDNSQDLFKKNIDMYRKKASINHYEKLSDIKDIEKFLIKKYFYGKILDMGCGCGRTTKYISNLGFDVVGVDVVKKMVKRARKVYPKIKFEVGDACNLKYKNNKFDIVFFSFNGIDYIYPENKRIKALKEISRVLKPGGYFIYSSHNPLSLFFRFRPKFVLRNIKKRRLFSKYKIEKNTFLTLYTYYACPKKQTKLVESNTNLKFIERFPKSIWERFPHYIFKKL